MRPATPDDDAVLEPTSERPRTLRARLARLIDVRAGEGPVLGVAVGFAFLAVAAAIVSRAVADALFLTAWPLSAVPRFFIVSNAVFIAGSMLYSALVRVVRPVALNSGMAALFAVTLAAGRALVPEHEGASVGLYTVCVWLTVAPAILNIVCWNAIADCFDSRQARRLVPIVFSGCTAGAILAGVGMAPFIDVFDVESLLYVLAGLVAACVPLPVLLARTGSRATDAPSRSFIRDASDGLWTILKEGITTVSRSRLLRLLALIVLLAGLVTNLVDYAFKGMLQARYDRDQIGAFYGYFNAVANTGNLVLQLFVVSWAMNRFGVARIFRVLPVTLLCGTLVLGLWPAFAAIVGLKLLDGLLRFTFQTSANEVVIAPIPYVERNRAKIFIKGAMNPLGAILAGLLLMPLAAGQVPIHALVVLLVVVLAAWLWLVRGISRAYSEQLYISLRDKQQHRTPIPDMAERFGGRHRRDRRSLVTSSVEWTTLSSELDTHSSHDDSPGPMPRPRSPSGRWLVPATHDNAFAAATSPSTPSPVADDDAHFPEAGLTDASPVVRQNTLEQLVGAARRGERPQVSSALLEGLLWREIGVAFALQSHRQRLGDVGSGPARKAVSLLGERLDDCVYRVFLVLGLLGEVELLRTAWFGLQADRGRTRAHAIDLVEATLEGTPFHRAVMLLLEEMSLDARLERAEDQLELGREVFREPLRVLVGEHDPQLNRLLLRLER